MKRSLLTLTLGLGALIPPGCSEPEPVEPIRQASAPITGTQAAYFVVLPGPGAVDAVPAGIDVRSAAAAAHSQKRIVAIEAEQAAIQPLLEGHGARVIARITRLANVVQVLVDEEGARRIAELPGVDSVQKVPLVERLLESAVPVIGAPKVWATAPGLTGDGVTIGIIDSGLDYTHADFAGPGTPDAYSTNDPDIIEPGSFPTAKVVGGVDFVGDAYNPTAGADSPIPDDDPLDCVTVIGEQISGGHGTHVAGIAAGTGVLPDGTCFTGPYDAATDLKALRVAPGVAPTAKLFALKIFGCQGSTTMLSAALDRAVDPNMDGSFDDRLDVVNASLGTPYSLSSSIIATMVTSLTRAGTLMVAAAGNESQNFYVTGSPGSLPEVLSVAASSDADLLTLRITDPPSAAYPISEALFSTRLVTVGSLSGPLVTSEPSLGCTPFTNTAEMAGAVALVDRGDCTFVTKAQNAIAAGAVAILVIDNEDQTLPFPMPGDANSSSIPAFMVTLDHGAALKGLLAQPTTVALDPADKWTGPGAELSVNFTSRGPSAVDQRLKPEISAPGGAINSAAVGTGADAVLNGGTSMASPVVAGAAALLRQAHPELGPLEVKEILVNAAAPLTDLAGAPYATGRVGSGRLDIARAVAADVSATVMGSSGEVGVSFGAVIASESTTVERPFVVTNRGDAAVSLSATVVPTFDLEGVVVAVSPATIDVAAGGTAMGTLTLSFDPTTFGNPGPDPGTPATQGQMEPQPRHWVNQATGVVVLSQPAVEDVVLPYLGSVRAADERVGVAPTVCGAVDESIEIAIDGVGANPDPVVTAFQLGGLGEVDEESATNPITAMTDLRAVGVATNLATAASFDEALVYFGVAVEGPWATPARGPVSVLKVRIDSDDDSSDEYEIRVEARNPEPPHRDALIASTYRLSTGERLGRFPVNVLTPDEAQTNPFNSTVLVLAANLDEIGVDEDEPFFDYEVRTERPDLLLLSQDDIKGHFDANALAVDTALHGSNGEPIFLAGAPVEVEVSADAAATGAPLDVLLLHHTNLPGQQWEVVSITTGVEGNVKVSGSAAVTAVEADAAPNEVTLVVTNAGDSTAPAVRVTADPTGGALVSATSSAGSCSAGASLECDLGDLAAGAAVEVKATLRPSEGATQVSLHATIESGLACETRTDDNVAEVVFSVLGAPPLDLQPVPVAEDEGCSCRAAGAPEGTSGWWLAALGALAAFGRRRASTQSGVTRPRGGGSASRSAPQR